MGLTITTFGDVGITRHDQKHDFYYRNGCAACPFRNQPKVEPYGAKAPAVYLLGEAAGKDEIKQRRPFVGAAGEMLRKHIPDAWQDDRKLLRWNNCVKARPPDNRTPTPQELAACRGFLEDDIVAAKPLAIFGFGNVPLAWSGMADSGITIWAGRRLPITVRNKAGESHTCWYFPMMHPSYVARMVQEARGEPRKGYTSEIEFAFHMHLQRAFDEVDAMQEGVFDTPVVHTRDMAMADIAWPTRYDDASVQRILDFLQDAHTEPTVGFDYETNALRPYNTGTKLLTAALATSRLTLAWPLEHREARWNARQLETLHGAFQDFLETYQGTIAVHNSAFEQEWSGLMYGKATVRAPKWGCSMSQAYVLDERQGGLALDFLTRQYFGFSIKGLSNVDRANLDAAPLSDVLPYNGCDAKYHRALYLKQRKRLKHEGLDDVYREHMRRVRAAVLTQMKGLPVNHKVSNRLLAKYTDLREAASAKIEATQAAKDYRERKGGPLKPAAPQDVGFLLNHVLPPKAVAKVAGDDGKVANVTEGTLTLVKHEIAPLILDWRKAHKVLSTYIEPVLPGSRHLYDDGLLHPQTRTTTVVTWRTSSDGPNYQNYPKRNGDRREVRGQIARKGYKVVSFDYAGIQARNVAMESKDPELVQAFRTRYDIHTDWTEQIAQLYPRWIKEGVNKLATDKVLFKHYRNLAKNQFVFPSLFGARDTTVAHYMGIPDEVGRTAQGMFWDRFGGVHKWHKKLLVQYREQGYVQGLSGWRRRAPVSPNELINTPIQGDEAAIVLDAMCRLSEMGKWALQPNMEIHDDLSFIWPAEDWERLARIVIGVMLNCPFKWAQIVPLGVECSVGDDWFKQDTVGEYFTDTWNGSL